MSLFSKNLSAAILGIASLLGATQASASYIDNKTDGSVVYSLHSTPNKILRYDMAAEANLSHIPLGKVPTAFTIANGKAYVAFGRELRSIDVAAGAEVFIKNTGTDISQVLAIGENLLVAEQSGAVTLIRIKDFHIIENPDSSIPSNSIFTVSDIESAVYYINGNSKYLSKFKINGEGKIGEHLGSPLYDSNSQSNKLFLNSSQNKVYTKSGIIAFTDLTLAGNLAQSFDNITFIGDNPIIVADKQLKAFAPLGTLMGEITLPSKPIFSASYGQKVFTFSESGSEVSAFISDLSQFKLPALGQTVNPLDAPYVPEFLEADDEGNIYAIDKETLSIFRWSTTQNTYLETWPLTSVPTSVTYSAIHKRLYMGYADGNIRYFSTAETAPKEQFLTTITSGIYRLLAAGQFLFVANQAEQYNSWHSEFILDLNGNTVNSISLPTVAEQYYWNAANNRIYRSNPDYYTAWEELDPITGSLTVTTSDNYIPADGDATFISNNGNQYLLNGAGQLLDPTNLKPTNSLSNSIKDGTWINGNLITIGKAPLSVQFWGLNYEQLFSYPLRGTSDAHLLMTNGKLVLVQQHSNGPSFTLFNPNQLPDTDSDGIHNFRDNCSNIANSDQANLDGDEQGDACDSDDDNDGVSDSKELSFGLNPLNATDAQADLDQDGFSNLVEIFHGSSIADISSVPTALSNYSENFENGWPAGFYSSSDRLPWNIQAGGATDNHSLISSPFINNDSASELNFTALLQAGQLSLKYKLQSSPASSSEYTISIFVDNVNVASRTLYSHESGWQSFNLDLTRGIHKISIRLTNAYTTGVGATAQLVVDNIQFQSNPNNNDADGDGLGWGFDNCAYTANKDQSDVDEDGDGDACDSFDNRPKDTDLDGIYDHLDNCPNIANQNQANIDGDSLGDACDIIDNRPKDTDLDGYYDDFDNCPLINNRQSDDMDFDRIGDACDSDTDGDGVANDVEKTFSFMNEKLPGDTKKDQDGDGVNNGYEIASGTKPDVADVFPSISLFDYYPVGEIETKAKYFTGNSYYLLAESMKRLPVQNTYEVISTFSYQDNPGQQSSRHIERKDTGIYLIKRSYTSTAYNPQISENVEVDIVTTLNNHLIVPASIKLGQIITNQSSSTWILFGTTYKEKITTTFELIKTGQTSWQGLSYPSVTIRVNIKSELENNLSNVEPDEYSQEITYLKGIGMTEDDFFTYETIDIISQDKPPAAGKKKSGGGAVDIGFLLSLMLLIAVGGRKKTSRLA